MIRKRLLGLALLLFFGCVQVAADEVISLPWPRAGVVVVQPTTAEALDLLGPVWYYEYGFDGGSLAGHQRLFLVSPGYSDKGLSRAMRAQRGAWWLVGNESNDPHQDNLSPGAYAAFYRRVVRAARHIDWTARVVPAGIANADWAWADAFRRAYRSQYGRYPPVDAWNIHNYVLEPDRDQLDVDEFQRRIIAFRGWMAHVGEGDKPLFLTEFGALFGTGRLGRPAEDPTRIANYVEAVVDWLVATDHVQCWAWFANDTKGQFFGDLYDTVGRLSVFGRAYRDAIREKLPE